MQSKYDSIVELYKQHLKKITADEIGRAHV